VGEGFGCACSFGGTSVDLEPDARIHWRLRPQQAMVRRDGDPFRRLCWRVLPTSLATSEWLPSGGWLDHGVGATVGWEASTETQPRRLVGRRQSLLWAQTCIGGFRSAGRNLSPASRRPAMATRCFLLGYIADALSTQIWMDLGENLILTCGMRPRQRL